jgi:hypothetical protein
LCSETSGDPNGSWALVHIVGYVGLLGRRTPKIAAVALANKMARMIWAMMMTGEHYREPAAVAV